MAKKGVKRAAKRAVKKRAAARRGRPKSVNLKNFTGRVTQNKDKTISIVGRGRRGK